MLLKVNSLLLVFYTNFVYSNDGSFIVQVPDDTPQELKVYWNAPTKQCKSKGVPFEDLYEKFGIIQNTGDLFERGDSVVILYDPGFFPAVSKDDSGGELKSRNGGVPHQGNLTEHLIKLQKTIQEIIPDDDFNGIAVIDQESWRPIYRWHWGGLAHYKDITIEIERNSSCSSPDVEENSCCTDDRCLEDKAKTRFEAAARDFMQTSLNLAKKLRRKAQWGYYAYPFCFNREIDECAKQTMGENELLEWLWKDSTALFPSVYPMLSLSSFLEPFIRGSINEAARIRDMYNKDIPILPYWRYQYRDGGFYSKDELTLMLDTFYYSEASGIVIWGASADMATTDKCKDLKQYVYDTLGPAIAEYTKPGNTKKGSKYHLPRTQEPYSVTSRPAVTSTITITDTPEITSKASTETKANDDSLCKNVTNTPIWTKPSNDSCVKDTSVVETIVKEMYMKEMKVTETIVKDTFDGCDSVKETKINETFSKESSVKETFVKETLHKGNSCGYVTREGCFVKKCPSLKATNINLDENETCTEDSEVNVVNPVNTVNVNNIPSVEIGGDKVDKITTRGSKGILFETNSQDVDVKGNSESLRAEKPPSEEITGVNILDTETRMIGNPSEIETSKGVDSETYNDITPTTDRVAEMNTAKTEMTTENTENYSQGSFWDQFLTTLDQRSTAANYNNTATESTEYSNETSTDDSNTKEYVISTDLQNTTNISLMATDQNSIETVTESESAEDDESEATAEATMSIF